MNKKEIISLISVSIVSFLFIYFGYKMCNYSSNIENTENTESAVITSDIRIEEETIMENYVTKNAIFEAKITSGKFKNQIVTVKQQLDNTIASTFKEVKKGDKILIVNDDVLSLDDGYDWYYAGRYRMSGMILLGLMFLLLILIIGRTKGIATIISLVFTIAVIFFVYIPSILVDNNIYISTIIVSIFIILSTLLILNGFNKKTYCAIVGNTGGIIVSGILALIVSKLLHVTGMASQDYLYLTLESGASLDLKAIVWGGILIGSLGAIMDVAMSIASSMHELANEMRDKTFKKLVKSGLNIGKDAIGTMTNTLILAYIGGSLATVLLFIIYNRNFLVIMNSEMIVVEFIQAIIGSIGILLAVPLTVFFSAWIFTKK